MKQIPAGTLENPLHQLGTARIPGLALPHPGGVQIRQREPASQALVKILRRRYDSVHHRLGQLGGASAGYLNEFKPAAVVRQAPPTDSLILFLGPVGPGRRIEHQSCAARAEQSEQQHGNHA